MFSLWTLNVSLWTLNVISVVRISAIAGRAHPLAPLYESNAIREATKPAHVVQLSVQPPLTPNSWDPHALQLKILGESLLCNAKKMF